MRMVIKMRIHTDLPNSENINNESGICKNEKRKRVKYDNSVGNVNILWRLNFP